MKQGVSSNKIESFTDLDAWKESHKLAISVYKVAMKLPKEENYGLASQLRRAAVSVTSNIAEGFSRQTIADKTHFYTMAHGSLTEIQNQLLLARDVKYLQDEKFKDLANQTVTAHKLITGLIKSTKKRNS